MKLAFSRRISYDPVANISIELACLDVMVNRKEEYQLAIALMQDAVEGMEKLMKDPSEPKHRFTVHRSMTTYPPPKPLLKIAPAKDVVILEPVKEAPTPVRKKKIVEKKSEAA